RGRLGATVVMAQRCAPWLCDGRRTRLRYDESGLVGRLHRASLRRLALAGASPDGSCPKVRVAECRLREYGHVCRGEGDVETIREGAIQLPVPPFPELSA